MLSQQEDHPMTDEQTTKKTRVRKGRTSPKEEPQPPVRSATKHSAAKRESKSEKVIALLRSANGATLHELVAATSWQQHTTRAALTGLKKKGYVVTSEKTDGVRRYRTDKRDD